VRSGRRLAIDVGKVRIGLAISDFHGILASGLTNVTRAKTLEQTCEAILLAIKDEDLLEIFVGLPLAMSGAHTASTLDAIEVAKALSELVQVPVKMIDERLSTVSATANLRASGRDSKSGRKVIDQIAATVILEQALQIEKQTGQGAGVSLEDLDD
jgi:putative Holliday junction resolvase